MGNTILIKHGAAVPNEKLHPYELGYCDNDGLLYIGGDYQRDEEGNIKTDDNGKIKLGNAISINPTLENARGVLQIKNGGTDATTAEQALINLGANNAANLTTGTLNSDRLPIIPIIKGGTEANNAADARNNIVRIGMNPTSATGDNDLPANWKALGVGVAYISDNTLTSINDQPTSWGYILNCVYGNLIVQSWFSYGSDTFIFKRTGTVDDNTWGNWIEGFSRNDIIPLGNGGTGATTAASAATNLKVLPLTGGTLTGNLTLPANKYFTSDAFGLDCQNSDIISINGLYFGDQTTSAGEGINFKNNDNTATWDSLYAVNGQLRFHPNRALDTNLSGNVIVHTGNHFTSLASGKDVTTAGKSFTVSSVGNYTAFLFYAQGNSSNANWMTLVVPKAMLSSTNKRFSITDGADAKHFNVSINSSNTMTVTAVSYYGSGITATSFGVYGIR